MNKKIIGILFIMCGAILATWGYNIYDSASSQLTRAINGDTPLEALVGIFGGVICILIGITRLK
jgi:hypothetical protein